MLVKFSKFSRLISDDIDTDIALKCVGRTTHGAYIISASQLRLAGIDESHFMYHPKIVLRTDGKMFVNHFAVKYFFIEEVKDV